MTVEQFQKILEKKNFFDLKSRFLPIWEVFDFDPFFIDLRKKWSFRLQTPLKNFLGVNWSCSRYLQGPPISGLSNAPTLVTIRHTETKWCKKNKKRAPEAPFEYYFSICGTWKKNQNSFFFNFCDFLRFNTISKSISEIFLFFCEFSEKWNLVFFSRSLIWTWDHEIWRKETSNTQERNQKLVIGCWPNVDHFGRKFWKNGFWKYPIKTRKSWKICNLVNE